MLLKYSSRTSFLFKKNNLEIISLFRQNKKFNSNKSENEIVVEQTENSQNINEGSTDNQLQVIKKYKVNDIYSVESKKMGPPDPKIHFDLSRITNKNVKMVKYTKEKFNQRVVTKEKAVPISPKLGAFEINSPVLQEKTYHWCSCGMSKTQPFCDSSHKGTHFKPVSFKLAEKIDKMYLCGCKLSLRAPFCDGSTCLELKAEEDRELGELCDKINENRLKQNENNNKV